MDLSNIQMLIKNEINLHPTRFWYNLHQVCSSQKLGKPNNLKVFGSKKTKQPKSVIKKYNPLMTFISKKLEISILNPNSHKSHIFFTKKILLVNKYMYKIMY
jgi:hypothetical protein